ncbi:MAG: hypothetical protein DRQ62_13900 [Gammaproteobacteria bacterium]|nr:MAG: hypothetical protein DRQ62_13900 [Gammaproteobacteria bacterium]
MPRLILLLTFILLTACAQKSTTETQYNSPVIKQTLLTDTERGLQRIDSLQRTALIIGNSDYAGGFSGIALKNPVNDANDLAIALKKLNFQLVHDAPLLDANKQEMEQAIKDFTQQLKQGHLGLFFYAGHGMQIDGVNYLIPLDTEFMSKADVRYNAINLNWLLAELEASRNPVNFILLDACRDNPFRGFRSSQKGLAESRAPEGSLISFATGPGKVAADGINQHNSPYTKALLSALTQPGLEVLSLFKYVRRDVKKSTHNEQTPWESHSLTEDIYFNGGPTDQISDQQLLEQLINIRKEHQLSENELQQELKKARDDAQRIRSQAQRIGISISPSLSLGELNDFEKALLIQQKQLVLTQQKNTDKAEYKKAKEINTSAAYLHYLNTCYPSCTYNDEAENAYRKLSVSENEQFYQQALSKSTSTAFQKYLDQCNAPCPHKKEVQKYLEITQSIEQQAQQDAAYFTQARKMASVPALAAYLTSCKICLETQQINSHWTQQQLAQLPTLALQQLNNAPRESLSAILKAKIAAQENLINPKELPKKPGVTTRVPNKVRVKVE